MLLPGYADSVDLQGYLIERCSECHQRSIFVVYELRRRLTITMIRTPVNIQQRRVMECRTCGAKFDVPKAWDADLPRRLMSQEQLSARIRELRGSMEVPTPQQRAGNGQRTAYQVLQVDPAADQDVIEAAFKRLALKSHPDRHDGPEAADRMRELVGARDLLLTPERRQAYDRSIGVARPPEAYRRDQTPTTPRPGRAGPATEPRRRHADAPASPRPEESPRTPTPPVALRPPGPRPKGIRADEV
jgi:hypothetical protein